MTVESGHQGSVDRTARSGPVAAALDDPRERLWSHAARLLELAVLPTLEPADARAALDDLGALVPALTAAMPEAPSVAALRMRLVRAAEVLCDDNARHGSAAERLARISRGRQQRLLISALQRHCIPDPGAEEQVAIDQLLHPRPDVDTPLLRDVHEFAGAPVERLHDADRLVRMQALVVRLLDGEDPQAVAAIGRRLLALPESDLIRLWTQVRDEGSNELEEPSTPVHPGPAVLESRLALHRELITTLSGIPAQLDVDRWVAAVQSALEAHLASASCLAVVAGSAERGESRLVLHGVPDLGGRTLALEAERSLAARALLDGTPAVQDPDPVNDGADLPVIDRQLARRLGCDRLMALPIFGPAPLGVLIVDAAADRYAALACATHLGPQLALMREAGERIEAADRAFRADYERHLREVVHEANNPLSIIHNYLHMLGSKLEDTSAGKEQLRRIGDEIRRTGEILRGLVEVPAQDLRVRPGQPPQPRTLVLGALIEDVVGLLEPALMAAAGIELEVDLDPQTPELDLDAGRLRQVLLNLLKNAVEAMADGGSLTIATRASVALRQGAGVEICITDSGPGLPPHLMSGLFAPGVSTKGSQRGLGLHIVRRLVEELDGTISAESRAGSGTTFRILLPSR